jgi:hypothetical protein
MVDLRVVSMTRVDAPTKGIVMTDANRIPPVAAQAKTLAVGPVVVPCADIVLVIAEGGISLDGGEMLPWKRNVVITRTGRHIQHGTPPANAAFFAQCMNLCPQALGIPFKGEWRMPQCPEGVDPAAFLRDGLGRARAELSRQAGRAVMAALLALAVAIGATILDVILITRGESFPRLLLFAPIVGAALFVLLLVRAFGQMGRTRKIGRVMTSLGG